MKPFIAKIKDFDDYEATINGELTNLAKEHAKVDKDRKDFLERHSLIDDDVIECKRPRVIIFIIVKKYYFFLDLIRWFG